jgi:hypothetical protein
MMARKLTVVALISMTLVALELGWTRIFSAEFFYTFAFLILSLAVMGLGLGALALRLFRPSGRDPDLAVVLSITGLLALVGPPSVFRLGLDFSILFSSGAMLGKVVLALVALGAPFFCGGIALASLFRTNHREIPRLYMADMMGAGVGVIVAIAFMNRIGTPETVFLVAFPVILAAFLAGDGWRRSLSILPLAVMASFYASAETLLEADREERAPVVYRHWDAMAKLKVYDFDGVYRGINIDNVANSPVIPFDGDWEAFRADTSGGGWDIDVGYLIAQFDSCSFLSLGAGGGMDVMHALDKGATRIHAVEVNPQINRMMVFGDPSGYVSHDSTVVDSTDRVITLAEFSGHIYRDPRVTVVTEDARTFVRRHRNEFDVIFSLSSNTWAALGSGSFALAESYLFTTEAFQDYWRALTPGGFLSMEHQVYMPRLVTEVIEALEGLGVESPRSHFAVYDLPQLRRNVLLLSKRPLTDELRYRAYGELTPERDETIHLLYPAPDSLRGNLIHRIVTEGRDAVADSADVDLSPCTDDRPFIAQMGLWRNLRGDRLEKINQYAEFRGFPISGLIVAIVLGVALVVGLPLMLAPYLRTGDRLRAGPWIYFFLIGVAFMVVEVVLIQQYSLFIGASVYSIATVLLTLLLASGLGSRFADRVGGGTAVVAIAGWLVLDALLFGRIASGLAGLTVVPRALAAGALVAPVGFFMGIPFPKGALRVGELVDWGFAVTGSASIVGGALAVLVAVNFGFTAALLSAAVLYLLAQGIASRESAW